MNHYTPLPSRIIISIANAASIYRCTVLLGLFGFVMLIAGLTGLLFYPSSFSKALGRLGVTVEAKSGWRTSNQMWSRMVTTSLRRLGLDPSAARLATSPAPFATLKVGPGETYATIQSAINAAATGDTIEVAPGTYTENLTINGKNLIILGPNRNLNDANATRAAEAIITAATNASLITIEANVTSYTIDGFNLVGADYTESNNGRMVWAKGAGTVSTIRNNLIDLTSNATGTKRYIWLGGAGSVSSGATYISGQISHNRFRAFGTGSGFNGLLMNQWSAAFTISGNKFENLTGQRNILIWHPSATTVVENNEFARVDSNSGDLLYIGGPAPGAAPAGPGIVIRNNKFTNSSKGLVLFTYGGMLL